MKVYQSNELESLAGLLPPEVVLLAAMLRDQIEELALLWAKGCWKEDPAELGSVPGGGAFLGRSVVIERQLWGPPTDSLIAVLERCTPIRIDRGRIASLARRNGERMLAGDGRLAKRGAVGPIPRRRSRKEASA